MEKNHKTYIGKFFGPFDYWLGWNAVGYWPAHPQVEAQLKREW